ncbi:MAG: InlB B-repeat-containing protein [Lachnospiraceae bacterium]|nr:InlB B-repeat-containing protein [Lachnospiraceae bacterium]
MKKKRLLKNIMCIFLGLMLITPRDIKADSIWDENFTGKGDGDITFRSYLSLDIYDYQQDSFLGNIKLTKVSGSAIDGEYVLKYGNRTVLTYRNDRDNCFISRGSSDYAKDLFLLLYNHSDKKIRGKEQYRIEARFNVKVFARGNLTGPYNGEGWNSLKEAMDANWEADTGKKPGGKGGSGNYLTGTCKLSPDQITNIDLMYQNAWSKIVTPEGVPFALTYDANGGKIKRKPLYTVYDNEPYEAVCIPDVPEREDCYFWGWSTGKYELNQGPQDYFALFHEDDIFTELWRNSTVYAVWGTEPFGEFAKGHIHVFKKRMTKTGTRCPYCGEPLYYWTETCQDCGEFRKGSDVPHTCPDSKVIYISGECMTCGVAGSSEGGFTVSGNVQRIPDITETGLSFTGHAFAGWNLSPDGSGQWLHPGDTYTVSERGKTVYIFAIWKPGNYHVRFDYGKEGLKDSKNMKMGEKERTVSFDDFMTDLPEPSLEGFRFEGWRSSELGIMVESHMRYGIPHDSVFVAKWSGHRITVTADPGFPYGATGKKMPEIYEMNGNRFTMDFGTRYSSHIPLSLKPSCDGWVFTGWSFKGESITDDTVCTLDEDHTITGNWSRRCIILTLDPVFGHFPGKNENEKMRIDVAWGSFVSLSEPKRTGYVFGGWYKDREGMGERIEEENVLFFEDTTLYAKWIPERYALNFDYCENWKYKAMDLKGNETDALFVNYGKTDALPTPSRYGYDFLGWSSGKIWDEEHKAYNGDPDLILKDGAWNVPREVTVYAVWKPVTVKVVYDYNYDIAEKEEEQGDGKEGAEP